MVFLSAPGAGDAAGQSAVVGLELFDFEGWERGFCDLVNGDKYRVCGLSADEEHWRCGAVGLVCGGVSTGDYFCSRAGGHCHCEADVAVGPFEAELGIGGCCVEVAEPCAGAGDLHFGGFELD